MEYTILLTEDDAFLRDGLQEVLLGEGYTVHTADCKEKAERLLRENRYNLAIFDVMLPDGNGLEICKKLRQSGNDVPILFLTACDEEIQVVRGLDAGADDYVTKPFKLFELLSRVRALLRRSRGAQKTNYGSINLDSEHMRVQKDGKEILLTPTEFQILAVLIRNSGIVLTRNNLLEAIWDNAGSYIDDNTLSVHIKRLRDKIGGEHIVTVRGFGYRWEDNP